MIWRYRYRLHSSGIRAEVGLLYDAYETHVWWFEMVDMLHKLFITSLVGFFPFAAQLDIAMAVVTLYLIVILSFRPYVRAGDDQLHKLAQVELMLLLMAGNVFNQSDVVSASLSTFLSFILITAFVGFFCICLVTVMVVGWRMFVATACFDRVIRKSQAYQKCFPAKPAKKKGPITIEEEMAKHIINRRDLRLKAVDSRFTHRNAEGEVTEKIELRANPLLAAAAQEGDGMSPLGEHEIMTAFSSIGGTTASTASLLRTEHASSFDDDGDETQHHKQSVFANVVPPGNLTPAQLTLKPGNSGESGESHS